jgi:hypothetical protein
MTRRTMATCGVLLGLTWPLVGCDQTASKPIPANTIPTLKIDGTKFVLPEEPTDAKTVLEARAATKDGDEVTVVGRIGGDRDPWVTDRAAFSIVDTSLTPCDERPGDTCKTPWDYCCEPDIAKAMATVKFVDDDGKTLAIDARQLLLVANLKELQTVVVKGQAKRDEAGNLTVLASGLFVRPNGEPKPNK